MAKKVVLICGEQYFKLVWLINKQEQLNLDKVVAVGENTEATEKCVDLCVYRLTCAWFMLADKEIECQFLNRKKINANLYKWTIFPSYTTERRWLPSPTRARPPDLGSPSLIGTIFYIQSIMYSSYCCCYYHFMISSTAWEENIFSSSSSLPFLCFSALVFSYYPIKNHVESSEWKGKKENCFSNEKNEGKDMKECGETNWRRWRGVNRNKRVRYIANQCCNGAISHRHMADDSEDSGFA